MLATALALTLAGPISAPQPQDAYVLARPNRIFRIADWDGAAPVIDYLYDLEFGGFGIWSGLEIDRQTGDLLVLTSDNLTLPAAGESALLRYNMSTGALISSWTIPIARLDGLEQDRDGTLLAIADGRELVRIDVANQTTESMPLSVPLEESILYGITMDERGMIIVEAFSGGPNNRYTIHPADGTVTSMPGALNILSLESDGQGKLLMGTLGFGQGLEIQDLATGQITTVPGSLVIGRGYGVALPNPVEGLGIHPICPAFPNSTGQGATLEVTGTANLAANELEFFSRRLPANSFGYMVTGPNVGFQPLGSGQLCIGAPQARYSNFPQNSGSTGVIRFGINAQRIPSGGAVMPGRTDVFQYWFRDIGSTSNLSDAVSVTWQ